MSDRAVKLPDFRYPRIMRTEDADGRGSYVHITLPLCDECGALVLEPKLHREWHARLGPETETAKEARYKRLVRKAYEV